MKKMKTLFKIDRTIHRAINEIVAESEWVVKGEGKATIKLDGTSCAIIDGKLYARYDVKKGRSVPLNAIPCEEKPDEKTGHWPHWTPVDDDPRWKHHREAFEKKDHWEDGTYELCGKKIQSGKSGIKENTLVKHGEYVLDESLFERSFEGLKAFLETFNGEGIVFHHPDGRMCKVRKKDFGIKW